MRLSPSAAERWLNCPGSVYIASQLPALPSSPAAEEGTLAHAFAAWELWGAMHGIEGAFTRHGMPVRPEYALATDEMLNSAIIYADGVVAKIAEIVRGRKATIEYGIEAAFESSPLRGRVDFFAMIECENEKSLLVADYKYGEYFVQAKGNLQLIAYIEGLNRVFKANKAYAGIIQPRNEVASDFGYFGASWACYSGESLESVLETFRKGMRDAEQSNDMSERRPGVWCKFCPARSVCYAAAGEKLLLAELAAGESRMHGDATNEQIGAWLSALKEIENARDDLARIARMRIANGEDIPGWHIGSRKTLSWSDEFTKGDVREQAEQLGQQLDVNPISLITEALISPAKAKKFVPMDTLKAVCVESNSSYLIQNK